VTEPAGYLGQSLGGFIDGLAAGTAAPAGGSAAALAVALAAALCAKSARLSHRQLTVAKADQLTREAEHIRAAAASLIDADALAYREVIKQMRLAAGQRSAGGQGSYGAGGTAGPGADVATALSSAAEVPLRVTELSAQTAALAAVLASDGNPSLRGDAACAAQLALAGGVAAADLVRINLDLAQLRDERTDLVSRLVTELRAAVGRVG
jgi:methenyltetrahydrofolate cyclohydrolase